jgi:hypothetical protein
MGLDGQRQGGVRCGRLVDRAGSGDAESRVLSEKRGVREVIGRYLGPGRTSQRALRRYQEWHFCCRRRAEASGPLETAYSVSSSLAATAGWCRSASGLCLCLAGEKKQRCAAGPDAGVEAEREGARSKARARPLWTLDIGRTGGGAYDSTSGLRSVSVAGHVESTNCV